MALNSMYSFFEIFAKRFVLSYLLKFDNMNIIHRGVVELQAHKAVIKGVFSRSYCCYGNLLCHENDNNVFTNDWAVFSYHDFSIKC